MSVRLVAASAVLTLVTAAPALAQDRAPESFDVDKDTITAGAGVAYLPDYEGSNNYRFVPAPAVIGSYKSFAFQILGNRASVDLIPNPAGPSVDLQVGPIAVLNFNRSSIKSIDDVRVKRLGELDRAVELGGFVGIGKTGVVTSPYDKLSISVSYRHDVTGTHRSGIWQPTINYLTPLSTKAAVAFYASAQRAGDGYASTYYSVSAAQRLASGLPVYNARGGWKNYEFGGAATYSLTGNLLHGVKVVAGGSYSRMLNDFARTPLVSIAGNRSQFLGAVGLAYTF